MTTRSRRARRAVCACSLVWLLFCAPAAGAATWFEVYVGEPHADVDKYAQQLQRIVIDEVHLVGPETLAREFKHPPRPGVADASITATKLIEDIELGYKAAARMQYQTAIPLLTAAIEQATNNQAVFVTDPSASTEMRRAYVQLGMSYYALGEIGKGADAFADVVRALDGQPLKGFSEAVQQRYSAASTLLAKSQPGKLLISVNDPDARIFLNEIGVGRGGTYGAGKLPGAYRALVIVKEQSLHYQVTVPPGGEVKVDLDWDFERALVVTPQRVALMLRAQPSRAKMLEYVTRLAHRTRDDSTIVTTTFTRACGAVALVARRYARGSSVVEKKVAHVVLDGDDADSAIRALLYNVLKDEPSADVRVGEPRADCSQQNEPDATDAEPAPRRWMMWTGIGAGILGVAAGGLSLKYVLDNRAAGDELKRVCAVMCTSEQARSLEDKQVVAARNAVIWGVAGAVLVVGGGALYFFSRRGGDRPQVSVLPTRGGAFATAGFEF